jgi:hypothetical protein
MPPRHGDDLVGPMYARFEVAASGLARLGGLPSPVEAAGILDDIWHLEAHNSTAANWPTGVFGAAAALDDQSLRAQP